MTHTIVINNCERTISAQMKGGDKLAPQMMVYYPGANIVETAKLKQLREESKLFDNHFVEKLESMRAEEGPGPERVGRPRLEVMSSKDATGKTKLLEDVDPKMPLTKLSPDTAAIVIKETFDDGILKRWLKSEARESVRSAIVEQVTFVTQGKTE